MRRTGVLLVLWLGVAVFAMAGGTWALLLADDAPDGSFRPLTAEEIRRALASQPPASATAPPAGPTTGAAPTRPERPPATTPPPASAATSRPTGLSSPGGSMTAVCQGGDVLLLSWTPATGYRADHVARGPAPVASVEFESDEADDVTVTVRCVRGVPTASTAVEADDHGGRRGGG